MDSLLLGIDVGTTAAKAALFSLDGQLLAVGSAEYPLHHLRPAWVEQQPEDWWLAVCLALRQLWTRFPDAPGRVAGLAVSAQAPTLIALDAAGAPVRPALIWMDRRAEVEAQELEHVLGADAIFRWTGNRPDAYYVAAKLRWYAKHEPDNLRRTRSFVQINGYVNYRLTGVLSLDAVHAALLQLWDATSQSWAEAIFEQCFVDPSLFPPIYPGHSVIGTVSAEAAQATGLRAGTPVMAGTVDGAAAALEAGVAAPGIAAEMTGTSTVLIMPSAQRLTDLSLIAMPHAAPNVHLLLGATVSSGASLRWYRDQFGQIEQQAAKLLDLDAFDLLTQEAARTPPGSGGVIFLPYMMGERSPLWDTDARGVLFGLSLMTPRGAVIRAILEGTAFALRHNVDVAAQAGMRLTEIRSIGGGARSDLWNQIKADVLGLPIVLPETSVGAPFGDAVLAGVGVGLYRDMIEVVQSAVHVRKRFEPDLARRGLYEPMYHLFRDLYTHLRSDFARAAALQLE